jgi:hypothetical protein
MNSFNRRTAWRIAAVSIVRATLASPVAWFVAQERAEESTVSLAIEESQRLLHHFNAITLAQMLANALTAALMIGLASLLCGAAIYPVVVRLSADNEQKAREVLDSHIAMMEALGRAIAKRDSDTGVHNFKPGRLDDGEFAIMRTHVAQGEEIVTGIGWLDGASAVVAGHHEKWNGSGYPRRLEGEQIPLAARIFAVADVFDALCSKRPYKEAMGFDAAMAILEMDTGSHFDPGVMAAFRSIARQVFERLAGCSEDEARCLLEERVRLHFGM